MAGDEALQFTDMCNSLSAAFLGSLHAGSMKKAKPETSSGDHIQKVRAARPRQPPPKESELSRATE